MENREELIAKFVDDIAEHDFKAVQTVADHKTVAITVKYKEVKKSNFISKIRHNNFFYSRKAEVIFVFKIRIF